MGSPVFLSSSIYEILKQRNETHDSDVVTSYMDIGESIIYGENLSKGH